MVLPALPASWPKLAVDVSRRPRDRCEDGCRIRRDDGRRRHSGTGSGASPSTSSRSTSAGVLEAAAIAALLRTVDKNSASAKVPEILKAIPADQKATLAREMLKKRDRKWVENRKDKSWAAELLAAAVAPAGTPAS